MNSKDNLIRGRPHGGVAFLWKKNLSLTFSTVEYNDPRVIGLNISGEGFTALILNVYLPYECDDNAPEFSDCLGKIMSIVEEANTPHTYIIGDLNADPNKGRFWADVIECC